MPLLRLKGIQLSTLKTLKGRLNVYHVGNTGIIDYHLIKLRTLYIDTANGSWSKNTLDKLWDIRAEQDMLLDARLEIMGVSSGDRVQFS